jgi:hypothetical protein
MQNIPFFKHKLVLLALAALIGFFVLCLPRYFREMGSASWPATQGVIVETNLVHAYGMKGMDGYLPGLQYRYTVGGQAYLGTRIDFHTQDHMYTPGYAESWLLKYPPGRTVTVYYDPKDPRITILEPGIKSEQRWIFYLGLMYLAGMSAAFVMVWYDLRRRGRLAEKFQERFLPNLLRHELTRRVERGKN